jgi:hypothetical protein
VLTKLGGKKEAENFMKHLALWEDEMANDKKDREKPHGAWSDNNHGKK